MKKFFDVVTLAYHPAFAAFSPSFVIEQAHDLAGIKCESTEWSLA